MYTSFKHCKLVETLPIVFGMIIFHLFKVLKYYLTF